MPTTQERPILKCPHCEAEIDSLDFRADASEQGRCSVYAENLQRTIGTGRNQRWEADPDHFEAATEDFETDDTEWNGDTNYYCPECGDNIGLHELIIETPEQKEKQEKEEEELEPEDAVETKTNIILKKPLTFDKWDTQRRIPGMPFEANDIDAYNCEECGHIFVSADKYNRNETVISCPMCGTEIDGETSRKQNLAKANK